MKPISHTPEAGVALMASAMFIAALMDIFAKLLTGTLSPETIGIGRFGAAGPV